MIRPPLSNCWLAEAEQYEYIGGPPKPANTVLIVAGLYAKQHILFTVAYIRDPYSQG